MKIQTIAGLGLFTIAAGCSLRANLLFGDIVAAINQLLPKEQAVPVYGFVRHRFFGILAEYRRLFPRGRLLLEFYVWCLIGLACWLACVGCLFFFTVGHVGRVAYP